MCAGRGFSGIVGKRLLIALTAVGVLVVLCASSRSAGANPLPAETTACPPGKLSDWKHIDGHRPFRIWYDTNGETTAEIHSLRHEAIELAGDLQDTIWPKETALMGVRPLLESVHRLKPALDICLVASVSAKGDENLGDTQARSRGSDCNFAHPQDILLPITYKHKALKVAKVRHALAHEFFHVLQKSLPNGACREAAWWREATATWAIQYVYPGEDRDLPDVYAPAYFNGFYSPGNNARFSIDEASSQGGSELEQYGAYVLPWYIAKTLNPGTVAETWHLIAGGASVDDAIAQALGSGGLRKLWPKFVIQNWAKPPVDLFRSWDSGFGDGASKVNPPKDADLNRPMDIAPVTLPHLSGGMWAWKIPAQARTVAFFDQPPFYSNPDGSQDPADPDAQVEAVITRDGKTERRTLTAKPGLADCFKLSGGHIDELLLSFSNSNPHNDLTLPGDPPRLTVTNDGCSEWHGRADATAHWTSGQYAGVTETSHATNMMFEPAPSTIPDAGLLYATYQTTAGHVSWSISGTDANGCTYSGSDSYDLTNGVGAFTMGWNDGSGSPATYAGGVGDPFIGRAVTVNQNCPDSGSTPVDWYEMPPWLANGFGPVPTLQDNGLTMDDSLVEQGDEATSSWTWHLTSSG